jgi:dihydrofolate reductase
LSHLHSNNIISVGEICVVTKPILKKLLKNKKTRRINNMRKIIVFSMITLDGVMQAPGGPKEDTSGRFKYGGWTAPYFDEAYSKVVKEELKPADYLLGRKTFKIWESYWPEHADFWPGINKGTKYVMSRTVKKSDWKNSVFLKSLAAIKNLKIQKVLTSRFGAAAKLFSYYLRTI